MRREGRWHGDRHIYPLMRVRWGLHTCAYPRGPPVHAPLWRADPSLGTLAELPGSSGGSEAEGGWGGAEDHSHSRPAGRGSCPAPGSWWAQLNWGGLGLALGHFPPGTGREKLVCPQGWECGCPPNPGTPVVYVDTASVTSCRRCCEHGNPIWGLRENIKACQGVSGIPALSQESRPEGNVSSHPGQGLPAVPLLLRAQDCALRPPLAL